jgi:ADP-ribosylation factor GTPase-activating protein 2/3
MKVGGNASATDFFNKHGGSSLLSDSDTKKKYSSRVGELYKEELAKRVKEDSLKFPQGIHIDGLEVTPTAPVQAAEDDFFDSWSKPSTPKNSNPSTPRVSTPPVIGRASSASSTTTQSTTSAPTISRTTTTTSAAAASNRASKLGSVSRLNSASSTSSAPKKSKLGLGASKTKPVDFAEAERKAKEEEERIKKLGYDRQREEEEERARKEEAAVQAAALEKMKALEIGNKATTSSSTSGATKPAGFPRLGFGGIPTAANTVAAAPVASKSIPDNAPTTARDKFGGQKAISSDMYFGRNAYDPNAVSEAQTRLQSFQGASSISSNQYFGRDEDEELERGLDNNILGDGSLAGLETAARDAYARLMANPDVQNLGDNIRTGALKLSDYLAQMSER